MQRTVCSRGGLPKNPLQTVFFGGGTPTQIDPSLIGQVLETVERVFGMCSDVEITVEANPGTVDLEKFSHLRSVGCNRLSLGVQSFDNYALKKLGRVHSSEEAIRAFSSAREAGFSNVSIDLIFSVPDVSEPAWKGSVDRAISLQPEHISAYALTIEEGTLFAKREREGMLVVLTEDDDALQYDWTRHRLMDAGFGQYMKFQTLHSVQGNLATIWAIGRAWSIWVWAFPPIVTLEESGFGISRILNPICSESKEYITGRGTRASRWTDCKTRAFLARVAYYESGRFINGDGAGNTEAELPHGLTGGRGISPLRTRSSRIG